MQLCLVLELSFHMFVKLRKDEFLGKNYLGNYTEGRRW